jgi:beta-lactamase regulating signal transducer with metallopeptidase domain
MNLETQNFCARLALAALNGLYQGVLLSAAVALVLAVLRWTNAATRYAVWFATLILVVLLLPAHYLLDSYPMRIGATVVRAPASPLNPVSATSPVTVLSASESSSTSGAEDGLQGAVAEEDSEAVRPMAEPNGFITEPAAPAMSERVSTSAPEASPLARLAPEWSVGPGRTSAVLMVALLLWGSVAAWRLGLLAWHLARLSKLAQSSIAVELPLQRMLEELSLAVRVNRAVSLRCSASNRSPVVLGFFRPMILLPASMAKESEETRQILSHELAHVRRWDDWANLFQHCLQALLFFHPAVWWISSRLSLEREIACDDHVLQQGVGPRKYALALASVASRIRVQTPLLASGISLSQSQLQQRIDMLLNKRRNASTGLAKGRLTSLLVFGVSISGAALYAAPRLVMAPTSVAPSAEVAVASDDSATIVAPASVQVHPTPAVTVSVAEGEPGPTPSPETVESGPKFKPEPGAEPTEPPAVADVPQPPASPDLRPPRKPRASRAIKAPRSADLMETDAGADGSVEQRLDRLEKLVHSLVDQNGIKRSHSMMVFKDGDNQNANFDQKQLEKMKQLAERQATRAAEQAERVTERTKRATRDMEARLQEEGMEKGEQGESLQHELDALRKAREGLNQQMEILQREIKKLEKQRQHGDSDPERHGEQHLDKMRAENLADPESNGF